MSPTRGTPISLTRHLIEEQRAGRISADLRRQIEVAARACKTISITLGNGAFGDAGSAEPSGAHQRVPAFLGSKREFAAATRYHLDYEAT